MHLNDGQLRALKKKYSERRTSISAIEFPNPADKAAVINDLQEKQKLETDLEFISESE